MRIRLINPDLVDDLIEFLRRSECVAEDAGGGTVEVELPRARGEEQARLELDLYLKVWEATHPGEPAELVEP